MPRIFLPGILSLSLVEGNRSVIRPVEPSEKPQQRALAAAAASDDGEKLSRGYMEAEGVQHWLAAKAAPEITYRD
jgi:hypothetical protein